MVALIGRRWSLSRPQDSTDGGSPTDGAERAPLSTEMLDSGDPDVQTAVAVLRGMQFVALVFLAWVTAK